MTIRNITVSIKDCKWFKLNGNNPTSNDSLYCHCHLQQPYLRAGEELTAEKAEVGVRRWRG